MSAPNDLPSEVDGERPGVKQDVIVRELRRSIIARELGPGAQLPTRTEIESRFGASRVTVQHALNSLARDGFVHATRRRGTFVCDHPPHLSRYALVFHSRPQDHSRRWTRFWTAMCNEAMRFQGAGGCQVVVCTGIESYSDNVDFQNLAEEIRRDRLAGLVFFSGAHGFEGTPLLGEGLPRVFVSDDAEPPSDAPPESAATSQASRQASQEAVVNLNYGSFIERALDELKSRGCSRLGVISHRDPAGSFNARVASAARERGFECQKQWLQSCSLELPRGADNAAHLLLHPDQKRRPDALLITDDNLVEHATAGVLASKAGEVQVVGHCNFPWPTPSSVPVRRLGFDARQILRLCLEHIDRQRAGKPSHSFTEVQALFDHEVSDQGSTSTPF